MISYFKNKIPEPYRVWLSKHSLGLFLFGGFIFDNLTLRRTDRLAENLVLLAYLVVAAVCIVAINHPWVREKARFWAQAALQFSFGNLFSAFIVFYSRSSAFGAIWPVLLLFVGLMIANEVWKKHYERLLLQLGVFYFSLFSFLSFFLPVILKNISVWVFILAGVVSLIIMYGVGRLMMVIARERVVTHRRALIWVVVSIYGVINFLYFTNLIPPIPLAMRDSGIYHSVTRVGGDYQVEREVGSWRDWFLLTERMHVVPSETLAAYTAIFSPSTLNTTLVHHWQYYDDEENDWVTMSEVAVPIIGGRAEGFRLFSVAAVRPGLWRVDVETKRGQVIGRVKFKVVPVGEAVEQVVEMK